MTTDNDGPLVLWGFVEMGGGSGVNCVAGILLSGLLVLGGVMLAPSLFRARPPYASNCKSNLKNLGAAMEVYAADWSGHYPPLGKTQLAPNYLKTLPECPAAGTDTYQVELGPSATYNTGAREDYYLFYCEGEHHLPVSVPANYPQYSAIVGLIEH